MNALRALTSSVSNAKFLAFDTPNTHTHTHHNNNNNNNNNNKKREVHDVFQMLKILAFLAELLQYNCIDRIVL